MCEYRDVAEVRPAVLVTPLTQEIPHIDHACYIGVDAGCLKIVEEGLPLCFGVGDFDSMQPQDLQRLKSLTDLDIHPIQKNETDSELALALCHEKGFSPLILTGGLQGRIDHTIANIRLLMYRYPDLILWEPDQKMYTLLQGVHTIRSTYRHISFFAIETAQISLSGFLYPLDSYILHPWDILTVSNSLKDKEGIVTIASGCLLCIESDIE